MFNNDTREWRRKTVNLKTWDALKLFLHCAHQEQRHAVTTVGKGEYTAAMKNFYRVPPTAPPEEHTKAFEYLYTIG